MRKLLVPVFALSLFAGAPAGATSGFVLWQLPSQVDTIGNMYVFRTPGGKVVVMDGGTKAETAYLRGFLAALGNEVEAWFVSHPHEDHIGALNEILQDPRGLRIATVYHSELAEAWYARNEPDCAALTRAFYANLKKSGVRVVSFDRPGAVIRIDKVSFKILGVANPEITANPYNNQCMVIRAWDRHKSMLFLADLGREAGEKLLTGPFRDDLDCDYLQMAHHGQNGVSKDFYRAVRFRACLWPTPTWVYNNDTGKGFNTHTFETVEIRNLMDELGIREHYVSCKGLCRIE